MACSWWGIRNVKKKGGRPDWKLKKKSHIDAIAPEEDSLLPMRRKSPAEPSNVEPTGPTTASNYDAHQWSLVPYQNDVSDIFITCKLLCNCVWPIQFIYSKILSLLRTATKPKTTILIIIWRGGEIHFPSIARGWRTCKWGVTDCFRWEIYH